MGVGFVSDLWHRLSVERLPDGLDGGPQRFQLLFLFLSLSLLLSVALLKPPPPLTLSFPHSGIGHTK